MSIQVTCDSCFTNFKAKDKYAGRTVLCKGCGEPITIPEPGDGPAADEWELEDDAPEQAAAPPRAGGQKRRKRRKKKSRPETASTFQFGAIGIASAVGAALFLLTCLIGIFWRPAWQLMFWGLMLTGTGILLVGAVRCLLVAFEEDVQCGVLYILVPFYALYYWATRIGECWRPLLMQVGGVALMLMTLLLFAVLPDVVPSDNGQPGLLTQIRRASAQNEQSAERIHDLTIQMHNHHDVHRRLPPHPEADGGEVHTSWMTCLLPFVEQQDVYDRIDREAAWDVAGNHEPNRTIVQDFLNPSIGEARGERDFGLAHYALNQEFLDDSGGIHIRDVTDGMSNTIIIGEVGGGYKPWADPSNVRDVSAGLVPGPDTFGNPVGEGGYMGIADGSVRWFRIDTDPEVLKAAGTRAGNDFAGF